MSICNLKNELLSQKASGFQGNAYQWTQVCFSYHSNSIEGSSCRKSSSPILSITYRFVLDPIQRIVMRKKKDQC